MSRYINPYTDFGFKRLFGTEPNKGILIAFLNALFAQETDAQFEQHVITDLKYLPGEHLGILETDRRAVFDVYCETTSGKKIIVEMQNSYQQFYKDRVLYYASIPIHEQGLKGTWNYSLHAVYVVSIMNFSFAQDAFSSLETAEHTADVSQDPSALTRYYHSRVMLMDTRKKTIFSDKLTLLFIETKKFQKTENELETELDKWIYLLKNVADLMEQPKCVSEPIFIQFLEQAEIARFSPEERRRYDSSIMAYRDVENSVDTARMDGFKEGLEKGHEDGLKEGLEKGHENGLKEGLEKGLKEGLEIAIASLMQTLGMSAEEAMEALRIPQRATTEHKDDVTHT